MTKKTRFIVICIVVVFLVMACAVSENDPQKGSEIFSGLDRSVILPGVGPEETRLFEEKFRRFLGLAPEDEVSRFSIDNPESVEALNQFRLYRIRNRLAELEEAIYEVGYPELWEVRIEYSPPGYRSQEERLTYRFRHPLWERRVIDLVIPKMIVIATETSFREVMNWEVVDKINHFKIGLRSRAVISEILTFWVFDVESSAPRIHFRWGTISLESREELQYFLEGIRSLESYRGSARTQEIQKFMKRLEGSE